MRLRIVVLNLTAAAAFVTPNVHAQAAQATANKPVEISTFGGLTAIATGLAGGKNLGITAGVNVGVRSFSGFRPFLEGRGTYPVVDGDVDHQKNAVGGVRVERMLRPGLRVYGDLLLGRGEIKYGNGGYPTPGGQELVVKSISNVYSPGLGAEYAFTDQLSGLIDVQFQRYGTPATPSGAIWAIPMMLGARYSFNFNGHEHTATP